MRFVFAFIAVMLAAIGFLSFWPLVLVGICTALLFGNFLTAVMLALLADLLYGVPVGILHAVPLPFTFLVLVLVVARMSLTPFLRDRIPTTL